MPSPPPRLAPTVALAALWVALYLLYLSVKPDAPATPSGRDGRTTTTTSVTAPGGDDQEISRPAVPESAPAPAR
ncbi:MAG: hypothetical protein ACRDYV_10430 [Acidimicrobiia bacterium]